MQRYFACKPGWHQRAAIMSAAVLEPEATLRGAFDVDRYAAVTDRAALDRGRVAGVRLGEADRAPHAIAPYFAFGFVRCRHGDQTASGA